MIPSRLILLAGLLALGSAGHLTAQPSGESVPVLELNAESIRDGVTANNNATMTLVPSPIRSAGQALKVQFDGKVANSGITIQPGQPWNWSAQGDCHFAFDVVNTSDRSVHLYCSVIDNYGVRMNRNGSIPVGDEPVTCAFLVREEGLEMKTGMADTPPPWPTDDIRFIGQKNTAKRLNTAKVARIVLYTGVTARDKQLVFDNFRIVPNPEIDPDFLVGICDEFGQNAKVEFPNKVHSDTELRKRADAELAELAKARGLSDRSRFGGWKNGPRLEATGYFRTEKVDGKWALVDPEGYLYFALGLANVRMANTATITGVDFREPTVRVVDPEDVTPEDSKGFIQTSAEARKTRFITSEMRHNMFTWLPPYDHPLADHYSYERSVHLGPVDHGESFSFYQANLERRYGETSPASYLTKWRDVTVGRMLNWGFTCMGNWVDPSFYHVDKIPYFANGWIIGNFKTVSKGLWAPMPDPFDPEFVRRAKMTTRVVGGEVKGSPWCVGVFVDNEKSWGRPGTFESQYVIVISALGMDATDSPTKAAFVRCLKGKYQTIGALNTAWETSVESWDAFAKGVRVSSRNNAVRADHSMLLSLYAEEYFRVVRDALHDVLPNQLYMGVRMAKWGMTPEVVNAARKYTDVISYNYYKEGFPQDDWAFLEDVDMPSIIGEFHMGATSDNGLFHPGLIYASDQTDRARMFREYVQGVVDNPYMVGAHWFQYTDSPLTGRTHDGENYNVGFVSNTDIPYPEMVDAAKELNRELYDRRFGGERKAK